MTGRGIGHVSGVPDRFSYDVHDDDGRVAVRLRGELDMAATLRLEPALDEVLAENGIRKLLIDLREVTFIDSTGFSALLAAQERAQAEEVELALLRPPEDVGRALRVSGLDSVLPFADGPPATR